MRYLLTESEALLIKQKFGYGQLLGLNEKQRIKIGTEKKLKEKGIVYSNNGKEELSNEYRFLFSSWKKMRYSIVRPDLNDRVNFQCVLSNEEMSIFFVRNKDVITIDLVDFSAERFEKIIIAFAELPNTETTDPMFNISMSMEDCDQLLRCREDGDFEIWEKTLGIGAQLLKKFVINVNDNFDARLLLVEDHIGDVGYLAKISITQEGIYAFKHITRHKQQKMVMLYGGTQFVTESIYNF